MRAVDASGVVDPVAEAVRQQGIVDCAMPALGLRTGEVLVRGHPVGECGIHRFEVTSTSTLLRAEAFRHLTSNLGNVAGLGSG